MSFKLNMEEKELFKAILLLKTEEECRKFFRDLLTVAEIKEFSNRWKAAQMLDQKIPYEEIARDTGMSSTTIARISKWLINGMGGYELMLKRINTNKNKKYHHKPFQAE